MNRKPLYFWLPTKIDQHLKGVTCNTCSTPIKRQNVIAIGLREHESLPKNVLYVEYKCPHCDRRACKLIENNKIQEIGDMCYYLIDELHKRRKLTASLTNKKNQKQRKKVDKISDKEMMDMHRFMQKNLSHEDFMTFIGSHPEKNK